MNTHEFYQKIEPVAIGIRIGNATSSISYMNNSGKMIIIVNEEGERYIPTALSFLDGEEYHGLQAKAQLIRNPKNTIIHFKKNFGKKVDYIDSYTSSYSAEPSILNDQLVYTITTASEEDKFDVKTITLDEVMISHLKYLKRCSEEYIGMPIIGAVFTVPTDFSSAQREALEKCAEKANLNVLQVIKEPIAEILAYSYEINRHDIKDKIIVVADFGETRSDATVVSSRDGMYTIIASESNQELGGKLLDDCIVDYFSKEFQKKYNLDPTKDPKAMAKLRAESEAVKKTLSSSNVSTISVECMLDGFDFYSNINRIRFKMLGQHIFDEMIMLVKNVIKKAQMQISDIDEVILAGGSSHIPKVSEMFSFIFPEKTLIRSQFLQTSTLSPTDIECYGAAIHASLISSIDKKNLSNLIHPSITYIPHLSNPIGVVIETDSEMKFIPVIYSYTPTPIQKSIVLDGPSNSGDFCVFIYEGTSSVDSKKIESIEPRASFDNDDLSFQEESRALFPSQRIAELIIQNVSSNVKIEVTIHVDLELKTTIIAKLLSFGQNSQIKGEVTAHCKKL